MLRKFRERIHNGEQGFTLIELLVVILIIGILAAIALPAFLGQRSKGQDADAKSNARNIVSHLESCYATEQDYTNCAASQDLTDSGIKFTTGTPAKGEVGLSGLGTAGYTVTGKSQSGGDFVITKTTAGIVRSCTPTNKGACPGSGKW